MLEITNNEFNKLADYIRNNYGISFKDEKKLLVMSRLQSVLNENSFNSFTEYFDFVMSDPTGEAIVTLMNKLTTNHTFFMRETAHFDYFKNTVLPYLSSVEAKSKDLRIWCAGCSTGEEPYTLAMIIADFFGMQKSLWETKILATDISTRALDAAVQGVYPEEDVASLPDSWKRNYLKKIESDSFIIADRIKEEVIYRRFNLMNTQFPFRQKFDVIFCRNVMIYFDHQTKIDLVNRFYEFTKPGGFLFIGHSESINRDETKYKYIMPAVYRKE